MEDSKNQDLLAKISNTAKLLFVVCAAGWLALFLTLKNPPWDIFITNFIYFISITQGVLAVAVILRMCSAKWSGVFYRLSMSTSLAFFPLAAIMVLFIIIFKDSIFYWTKPEYYHHWHNSFFFVARNVVSLLLFYGLAWLTFSRSKVKTEKKIEFINSQHLRLGFFLLAAYLLNETLISWDLAMLLNPHYGETIYSIQFIGSSILGGSAVLVLLMTFFKNRLGTRVFTPDHFSNMGKLILALVIILAYFKWSQFFAIWFANMPIETNIFYLRVFSKYKPIYILMVLSTITVPFIALIFSKIRDSERFLPIVSALILIGIWLDSYLVVTPALVKKHKVVESFILSPSNILFTLVILSSFTYLLSSFLRKNPSVIPASDEEIANDPLIAKAQGWQ